MLRNVHMYMTYNATFCMIVHCCRTPFMLAVTNGNSKLAQVLVDHDAQVDCTDKHLRTALHRAVSNSFFSFYMTLFKSHIHMQ